VDIKSAYLNAELKDMIYMCALPGYLKGKDEGKVLKLKRSLYGLKQAGFEWSEELGISIRNNLSMGPPITIGIII